MPSHFRRLCRFLFALFAILSAARSAEPPTPDFAFLYGRDELFPSVLVSLTGTSSLGPRDPAQLGDPRGAVAVVVRAPVAGATVRVTFAATPFFAESTVAERLPEANRDYRVAPTIRFYNERLAALRQPVANLVLKATVELDGVRREIFRRVVVRSIRECPVVWPAGPATPGAEWRKLAPWLLAAYANENHPAIDQTITQRAYHLADVKLTQFAGYVPQQSNPFSRAATYLPGLSSLDTEIEAIYGSLKALGFRHVNLGLPAIDGAPAKGEIVVRSVRLLGEVVASRQASELEAALLFASVLRKLSVDAALLFLPENRVILGVYRRPGFNPADLQLIDLRNLASATFAEAKAAGEEACKLYRAELWPQDTRTTEEKKANPRPPSPLTAGQFPRAFALDLDAARALGVLPIPEAR